MSSGGSAELSEAIEAASLRAWPALEEEEVGSWVLKFSDGFTKRGNSVQPLAGATPPPEDAVARCEEWYRERGAPCAFRLTPLSEPGLDQALAERGYERLDPTAVLSWDPGDDVVPAAGTELESASLVDWLAYFSRLSGLAEEAWPSLRRIVSSIGPPTHLVILYATDPRRPVGCGMAVLDRDLMGLFDLIIDTAERRRGYGADLVRHLVAWGRLRGARTAYLQVTLDNIPAANLYERLGFRPAYQYWYRIEKS